MEVYSELRGPLTDAEIREIPPGSQELFWDRNGSCYTARRHPEIPNVSWSYGNLVRAWNRVIAEYPNHSIADRVGSEGIVFTEEVAAIADYLATVEPRPEHGQDFVGRLEQVKRIFGAAREFSGGAIYNS